MSKSEIEQQQQQQNKTYKPTGNHDMFKETISSLDNKPKERELYELPDKNSNLQINELTESTERQLYKIREMMHEQMRISTKR